VQVTDPTDARLPHDVRDLTTLASPIGVRNVFSKFSKTGADGVIQSTRTTRSVASVLDASSGTPRVYHFSEDYRLYELSSSGGAWHDNPVGNPAVVAAPASGLAACVDSQMGVNVFFIASPNLHLMRMTRSREPGASWSAPLDLTSTGGSGVLPSPGCLASNDATGVYFTDTDGHVHILSDQPYIGRWQRDIDLTGSSAVSPTTPGGTLACPFGSVAPRVCFLSVPDGHVHEFALGKPPSPTTWSHSDLTVLARGAAAATNSQLAYALTPDPTVFYIARDGHIHSLSLKGSVTGTWTDRDLMGAYSPSKVADPIGSLACIGRTNYNKFSLYFLSMDTTIHCIEGNTNDPPDLKDRLVRTIVLDR
jgi:hypothetical protein